MNTTTSTPAARWSRHDVCRLDFLGRPTPVYTLHLRVVGSAAPAPRSAAALVVVR